MTHDALFKQLLKTPTVFESFFGAFLPKAAQSVDFTRLEFVDKERITIDGEKRTGDLLSRPAFRERPLDFLSISNIRPSVVPTCHGECSNISCLTAASTPCLFIQLRY